MDAWEALDSGDYAAAESLFRERNGRSMPTPRGDRFASRQDRQFSVEVNIVVRCMSCDAVASGPACKCPWCGCKDLEVLA